MLLGSSKSNLTCEAGCGLRFHSRIILGSCSDRPRIGNDVSPVFRKNFCQDVKWSFWAWHAQYLVSLRVTLVAPHIVNEVSYVTRMNYACHFLW